MPLPFLKTGVLNKHERSLEVIKIYYHRTAMSVRVSKPILEQKMHFEMEK